MARNDDFSSALFEALLETFNTTDDPCRDRPPRRKATSKLRSVRVDLQGVTIERMVVEVPRE